jgi:hypothetical protein
MAKKQEVAAQTAQTAVAVVAPAVMAGMENVGVRDIMIPRVFLMQSNSKLVAVEAAKAGEFRDSLETDKVLGDSKKPAQVVFFGSFKAWREFIKVKVKGEEKLEWRKTVIIDSPATANLPREEVLEDGDVLVRRPVQGWYCLNVADINATSLGFPYVIIFKSKSYMVGNKIATHGAKLGAMGRSLLSQVFALSCTQESNDKNQKYYLPDVKSLRVTTDVELAAVTHWHAQLIKNQTVKAAIHEDEEEAAGDDARSAAAPVGSKKVPQSELRI